MKYIKLIT